MFEASQLLRGPDSILAGPYVGTNVASAWGRRWSGLEIFEAARGRVGAALLRHWAHWSGVAAAREGRGGGAGSHLRS